MCQSASSAATKRPWPFGFLGCFRSYLKQSAVDFRSVRHTNRTHFPGARPPLILSAAMRREALAMDHAAAVRRRDMQAVHRIEADLRNVTTAILAKGV